ncbi:hypothetical protein Hanom_Chr16g01415091 [Helianthus anomalus]
MSEALPVNTKVSLSKHLKTLWPSSSLTSRPILGSLKAPSTIPAAPVESQAKGKGPETSAAPIELVVPTYPTQATSQSRF